MSNGNPPGLRSVEQLASEIRGGLSPVDLVEEHLQRIEERNGAINALIEVDHDGARATARQAESEIRAGRYRGPLHGIPIAVKDVIDVAGLPTTGGSRLLDGHPAEADADCVANLRAAGAIIIGKANMHELTAGNHANPWFGKVVNPLDAGSGTGGTSSGSAAAVAAGFCAAALGTDTGGSNRSVAAATGLIGYKPSNGLISSMGVRPTAPTLDTVGPIALSVADARLVTRAMLGRTAVETRPAAREGSLDLRVAICPALYADDLDPAVRDGMATWMESLLQSGARFEQRQFPYADELATAGLTILQYEFATEYGAKIDEHPDLVGTAVHEFLTSSRRWQQADYAAALDERVRLRGEFFALLDGVDGLMVPTTPGFAPRLSDEHTQVGDRFLPYGPAGGRFRRWANVFGMPTIALPLPTDGALGASVQLAALPGQDGDVFQIASRLPVRSLITH